MSEPPSIVSGTRLAALRMFRGRTQSDLARALGKSQGTIARYETNGLNAGATLARIAHELGHLVLHQGRDHGDEDRPQFEDEANRFASEFLAPISAFPRECPRRFDVDAFALLRGRWGLSIQVLVRRGRDCGNLSEWQYQDAYRRMSALGWRSGPEPGCPSREESFVHARLFDVLGDRPRGVATFFERTGLRPSVLTELMPEAAKHLAPTKIADLFDERAPLGLD